MLLPARWNWASIARWIAPWMVTFGVAFIGDQLTHQAYSSFWGSAAIVIGMLWSFPGLRAWSLAAMTYGGVWISFNLLRALASSENWAIVRPSLIGHLDDQLLGGAVTSQRMQAWWFARSGLSPLDVALTLVHLSFFVVPFLIALLLWVQQRRAFWRLVLATACCFALSLAGFFLMPTTPPWMAHPDTVSRIPHLVLVDAGLLRDGAGSAYGFEPNALAAFPSVHVAATVLVLMAMWTNAGRWRGARSIQCASLLYALAMSFGVVYLGEHYLLDVLGGWLVASAGWVFSGWILTDRQRAGWMKRPRFHRGRY